MIKFPMFRRQYMAFRTSAFRTINNLKDLPELPYGSVLHILDLFKMNEPVRMAPALNNPLLNLNKDKLLICNITHPSQCDTGPAPIAINKMIMTNAGVLTALMAYRRQMGSRVFGKYFDSVKDLPIRPGAQAVVNYNPLFRARVMGQRRKVRFMNMLWGCIVNTIMQAQDRMHFIHVPLESLMFERQHFIRVFKKYDRVATKFPEISSYLFLAHLYAILMKNMSLPPRGVALDDEDATECFEVDPSIDNPDLVCEDFLANIKDTVLKDPETALEFIKTKDFENPYQVSIFEYLPARVFENVNFILTCGDQYIIYNLRDLKELNGNAGSGIMRIIRHVNMLAAAGEKTELPAEANDYMVGEEITEVDETGTKANQPEFVVPMTQEEKADAIEQDLKDLNDIDKILSQEFKTQKKPLTEAQKSHIEEIGVKYKQLELNGKSLATLLASVPENTAVANLPSVKPQTPGETTGGSKPGKTETGKDTGIPMPTPANARAEATKLSSVAEMDTNYLKAQFDRDLASVLTFFNTKGMFLTELKTEDKVDELNTHSKITAKYEDINHKKHTISFTIPKPNEFGVFLDNGNLKAMRKQRVSNPITKASDVRVTLNSNYNKLLVERNTNAAHNFENWFKNAVGKAREAGFKMMLVHGSCKYPDTALPYELTALGSKYEKITFDNGGMFFDIPNRANNIPQEYREKMGNLEEGCGVWFGHRGDLQFFMTNKGLVQVKSYEDEEEVFYGAFLDFMEWLTEAKLPPMTEFCELTVLSRVVPVIHPLAYRYGLTNMLNYCGAKYELADRNAHVEQRLSDIVIKFKDKKLIIERTPRNLALLFGGLCIYDFSDVLYEDMDDKNVYYEMLSQKGVSTHLIKGIDSLFDLFIDPITKDILREMNEPTDIRDLLIRAVTLLTTSEHKNAASATNFRFRGFEQITGIIYNEMAKAFATYQNKMINGQNNFSMSEFQIKQRILHEQLMENVNTLNPIDDIKQYSKFSNSGSGGRSNDTFMIPDRNFTPDSVGIVSEATVDNGKTGLNAMLPFNPIIVNNRGMCTQADLEQLKPENMLSITSLLYPCVTHDD